MSDLRPTGVPVMLEGVERHLLFTLNAIDRIQDCFDKALYEVIDQLSDDRKFGQTLKAILAILLEDEVERKTHEQGECSLKQYSPEELGWLITQENAWIMMRSVLAAYGVSLPEPEDDSPNQKSGTTNL